MRFGQFLLVLAAARGSATSFAQPFYSFETYAGAKGGAGVVDGKGSAARFNMPAALAVDAQGNVWVADSLNNTIRRITPNGDVTTVAGKAGVSGFVDGVGAEARFTLPSNIAVDAAGNALVTEAQNQAVRKVSADGRVTTLAGRTYEGGQADGLGQAALFYHPRGIAVDAQNNAYVLHTTGGIVRKISPAGQVTTVAANSPNILYGGGLAIGSDGDFYVAEASANTIWKIGADGVTSAFAREYVSLDGATTRLSGPAGIIAVGADFYVADYGNHVIRKIDSVGAITTFTGQVGKFGSADGTRATARFYGPQGLAADAMGNIYVADRNNYAIRKIGIDGTVTTLAGLPEPTGHADGPAGRAQFRNPRAIALDTAGNVYVADTTNRMIRKITRSGSVTSLGDDAFVAPASVAVDGTGTLYVADAQGHFVGKISAEGVVTRWAGSPAGETVMKGAADGQGLLARFDEPSGVAVNSEGTVYVADFGSHIIRKITPAGFVSTLAGVAYQPGALDGAGVDARFLRPAAIAVDATGMI